MKSGNAKTVAVTGASSFTGYWIARAFTEAGWNVSALVPGQQDQYTGLKKLRLAQLESGGSGISYGIRAENGGLAQWAIRNQPQIWIHHHHWMENYRCRATSNSDEKDTYDLQKANDVCIEPLTFLVDALRSADCRGVVYSGTLFEPGEGGNSLDYPATPYAASKLQTWKALLEICWAQNVKIAKVVIPNPIGALENEDRLTPMLVKQAQASDVFRANSPDSVSDYLPGEIIARSYLRLATQLLASEESQTEVPIARPSGRICTVREWIDLAQRELITERLGLPACHVEWGNAAPSSFKNPAAEEQKVDWSAFWDQYAEFYR